MTILSIADASTESVLPLARYSLCYRDRELRSETLVPIGYITTTKASIVTATAVVQ